MIARSPGKDFFTAFATLPPEQLVLLKRNQDEIASGKFGHVTNESVVFEGRSAVARTINPAIDPSIFKPGGGPVPINACPFIPVSTLQSWGQSLFIRDRAIVQDPARTWDPCTGAGTQGGPWTFAHLIREMAIPFKVGPITDLGVVQQLLDLRAKFATGTTEEPADFIRRTDTFSE